jgi:cell division protein FtsW (lipid II flippase)
MISFRMRKLSDQRIWLAAGALLLISLLAIFSTTFRMQLRYGLDPFIFVKRQFFSLLIGLTGLSLAMYFDYNHLKKAAPYIFALIVLMLVRFFLAGPARKELNAGLIWGRSPFNLQRFPNWL